MSKLTLPANDALAWIRAALEHLRLDPVRWLGMTLVFLIIALVFKRIPFLGNFMVVLLSPIMLSGALLALRAPPWATPANAKAWLRALTTDSVRELFQVFRREEQGFTMSIVCIVTLGLVMLVNIPELLITGGSVVSGLTGPSIAGGLRPLMILGILIVIGLYLLLAMALFYLVPLTLFGRRQPITAVAESFRKCLEHRKSLAMFAAPFLAINLLIMLVFSVSHALGYLLLATLGVVSLPTFVIGLHHSYRALFETPGHAIVAPAGS